MKLSGYYFWQLNQLVMPAKAGIHRQMTALKQYYCYIMTNFKNGTLYVGVTSDLLKRVYQHRNEIGGQFASKYRLTRLVWFEIHRDVNEAILREKQVKRWKRERKINLIQSLNLNWTDLYPSLLDGCLPPQA